jgi:hypothetical protein
VLSEAEDWDELRIHGALVEGVFVRVEVDESWRNEAKATLDDIATVASRISGLSEHAHTPKQRESLERALQWTRLTMRALVASVDYKCNLDTPPEDIRGRPEGPGGSMVHKCFHKSPHCWDGSWNRLDPCPQETAFEL